MYQQDGKLTLTNVSISGNTASCAGGAIYQQDGDLALTNVIISGNAASGDGGAIHQWYGATTLTNVTISGNRASNDGGGIYQSFGKLTWRNTIVARNEAETGSDLYQRNDAETSSDMLRYLRRLSSSHSLIGDGSGQSDLRNGVHGNLVGIHANPIDPQFVSIDGTDWTKWDLHLRPTSPAINAGDKSLIPKRVRTDVAGNKRVFGASVDIGAYEVQVLPPMASTSINGGAAQRSMVKQLVVVFRERVTLADGAVTVLLSSGEAVPDTMVDVSNPSGDKKKYVVTFRGAGVVGGSLADGLYDLVVHGEYVRDMAGNTSSGTYTRRFHRLFGDADGNGTVNAADSHQLQIARAWFGGRLLKSIFDFDGNGILTSSDVNEFLQRYGSGV
jgi:predicted outer membrane repeat protein